MKQVVLSPEADEEIVEAVAYYAEQDAALGRRFFACLRQGLEGIGEYPGAAPAVSAGIRKKTLAEFPYSILYRERSDRVRVLAVRHHARRPDPRWAR